VAAITSGSDHSVFNAGGIPAMQFNYWPDNYYHSSEDRIVRVDPTELKRVGFTAAAAFAYLAGAGAVEARDLAWESAGNGAKWISEVAKQSVRLLAKDPAKIHEGHKAAQNKVGGAFGRARAGVESVRSLSRAPEVESLVKTLSGGLEANRKAASAMVEAVYRDVCADLGVKPAAIALTDKEREYAQLVPRRKFRVYSPEAQKLGQGQRGGQPPAQPPAQAQPPVPPAKPAAAAGAPPAAPAKPAAGAPQAGAPPGGQRGGMGFASTSTNYFIDGQRTILDIYNAVRAECGNLQVGSNEGKFAYVLGPEYPDVDIEAVANIIRNLEKQGVVEILKKK
jgi:hypothetical protein